MKPMVLNCLTFSSLLLTTLLAVSGCVSDPQRAEDNSSVVLGVDPVKPAQIGEDECVNFVQLERNAAYQCELANGETRAMREGERRSTALTKEEIIEIITKNGEDADHCIAEAERKDPNAKGKIVISFEVEPDGQISEAHVVSDKSSYKSDSAAQCLIAKIKQWRFPVLHNDDSLEIKFPFTFGEVEETSELPTPPPLGTGSNENQNTLGNSQPNTLQEIPNKKTIKKTRKK